MAKWMPGVWQQGDTVEVSFPEPGKWVKRTLRKGTLLWKIVDPPSVTARVGQRWMFGNPCGDGWSICESWITGDIGPLPAVVVRNGILYLHGTRLRPREAWKVWKAWKAGALFQKPQTKRADSGAQSDLFD